MTKITKLPNHNENIELFLLENDVLKITLSNLGCRILSILAPDKNGNVADMLLGLQSLDDAPNDGAHFGAVVGRFANRIKNGQFTLNGVDYEVSRNNHGNALHGGFDGFDRKVFSSKMLDDGIIFTYVSEDGEEGFPGELTLNVTYQLENDTLFVTYNATTTKDTICNFSNHAYFNLSGTENSVLDHQLFVDADKVAFVDDCCMVNGIISEVENSVFDFRKEKSIISNMDWEDEQIKNAKGYDHPFIFTHGDMNVRNDKASGEKANLPLPSYPDHADIKLKDSVSGRTLIINTTMPAVHVYTGNFLDVAPAGKSGEVYKVHTGIALETEMLPNAINNEYKNQVILRSNEEFVSKTSYKFTNE